MHFQTFSIVVGTAACNAHCPFCISKQTGLVHSPPKVNWRNFAIACKLAQKADTTTVLLTGKGEPTLYPEHITATLRELQPYGFPLVEMQTNGITIGEGTVSDAQLAQWLQLGLTTIAISVVHWDKEMNRKIYRPTKENYPALADIIKKLHQIGFSVRVCCMLLKDYVNTPVKVGQMIAFCEENKVEQLTFRNITASDVTASEEVTQWTNNHTLAPESLSAIVEGVQGCGTLLHHLMHGMDVYDVDGQNVCLGNCLTMDPNQKNEFRQLIFFPDGSLFWDWQYKGARIL